MLRLVLATKLILLIFDFAQLQIESHVESSMNSSSLMLVHTFNRSICTSRGFENMMLCESDTDTSTRDVILAQDAAGGIGRLPDVPACKSMSDQ